MAFLLDYRFIIFLVLFRKASSYFLSMVLISRGWDLIKYGILKPKNVNLIINGQKWGKRKKSVGLLFVVPPYEIV